MDELKTEESNIIYLSDEDGNEVAFEFLDVIPYKNDNYMVLLPTNEEETEIVILKILNMDKDDESYVSIDDLDTLNAVYDVFKEKYKDILTFES